MRASSDSPSTAPCLGFFCITHFFPFPLSPPDLNLIDKESDDVLERIMDEKTASESKILHGHSGPVYGVSFSPDRYKNV